MRLGTPINVTYYTPRADAVTPSAISADKKDMKSTPAENINDGENSQHSHTQDEVISTFNEEQTLQAGEKDVAEVASEEHLDQDKLPFASFASIASPFITIGPGASQSSSQLSISRSTTEAESASPLISDSYQPDLRDTVRVDADEVAVGLAQELFEKAQFYKENLQLDDAATFFSFASGRFEELEGPASLNTLKSLAGLAETYESLTQLGKAVDWSVEDYRRVIAWHDGASGLSSLGSLRPKLGLSYALMKELKYAEAKSTCQKALAGFRDFRMEDERIECQCLLGEVMRHVDKGEAEKCLVGALADSLNRMLVPEIRAAVTSLLEMVLPQGVLSTFAKMLQLLQDQDSISQCARSLSSEVLFQAIKIASEYSVVQSPDFDYAGPLFLSLVAQIGRLSSRKHGEEKARAFLEIALHCERRQSWGECVSHLKLVSSTIEACRGKDNSDARHVRKCVDELKSVLWAKDGCSCENLPELFQTQIAKLRFPLDLKVASGSRYATMDGGWHGVNQWYDEWGIPGWARSNVTTTSMGEYNGMRKTPTSLSSRSYRYGVTYSEHSIAGVTDSLSNFV